MRLNAKTRIGIKGEVADTESHAEDPQGSMPCGFMRFDLSVPRLSAAAAGTSSPPQFGQTLFISFEQFSQKVHS